ncbi:MATE family efflux transporter [Streptococcus cuniculipharyngis]|uniref:Probable multidrug resistance protein NorM n=1 Tax=Streptococcus cuniculipharyngis TaxID=1562651 RepID=A0A5C5SC33_9STRE|nr:MATE family efflux transporter [Streptococcus cuniculipharyngis]TWS97172.1 MATE family efflux transporter [Streptococcus cuniculipharyngis]
MGTPTDISRLGATYLAYVGGSVVLLGLTMSLSAMARVKGMLNFPLLVSLWTNLLNLCLSALAIFAFPWGLVGVALATVMSRFLGCLWLWLRLDLFKSWAWTGNLLSSKLLALTLPAVGERLMMRLGDLLTLTLLTGLGTKVIAANSIGESLTQFNYLPALGMATATLILVAEAYGKQELQAGADVLKRAYVLASPMMLLLSGMIYGLGQDLIGFFTADGAVRAGSRIVLFYSFLGSPITAGVMVLTSFWQAVGKSQLPLYATSFGMWGIRIGLGYLLIAQFQLGLTGLWLATILDNLWRLVYLCYHYTKYETVD